MKTKWSEGLYVFFLVLLFPLIPFQRFLNCRLKTTYYTIPSKKLPASFDGVRILQISDLHNTQLGKDSLTLLSEIKKAAPDVIVVTGDLVEYCSAENNRKSLEIMKETVKIAPVYYVTGNHEFKTTGYEALEADLKTVGVKVTDDRRIVWARGGEKIVLYGLKDYKSSLKKLPKAERNSRLNERLQALKGKKEEFSVLLSHRPELFGLYAQNGFDLIFCGHAHGGQIRIFNRGIVAPNQGLFPRYTAGIYTKAASRMVVSRGLGNSAFPFRINNDPELVVVTLKRE